VRICYIVSEYFAWGQYGGYGTITRALADGLAARGHEVFALVPKKTTQAEREQRDVERVGDVTVVGLPRAYRARLLRRELYRRPRAELYVSIDARFDSWLAMRASPGAKHAIWLLDPMPFAEYWAQHRGDPASARPGEKWATRLAFESLRAFGRSALRRADAVWSQPEQLPESARRALALERPVRFVPNPVELPEGPIEKSPRPLVLFLGRFDWQKQPETFFALARRFPDVHFVAAGAASDPTRDASLRERQRGVPNLELPGVVTGEAKDALLRRAWVLCNTSLREGLPRSLQEGLAYGCALVAAVDPDRLVSRFGARAHDRDFEDALRGLLADDAWRARGAAGREYVRATCETQRALDAHEALYRELVG
jgi:glycosyltransferase involved in cell wall biosynthesis